MGNQNHCPHQWIQASSFVPNWAQQTPDSGCPPQSQSLTPNPVFPSSATLPTCKPLEIKQINPKALLVTISIPAETIYSLPTNALEIKSIRKKLKVTQCRFFSSSPSLRDTAKLFLGGFIRKDIQYSEPIRQTSTTVEGIIKDFVIDIPYTCVIDLGKGLGTPPTHFNQQQEYEFLSTSPLPSGFSRKDKLMSGDLSEFNSISSEFFNKLPSCTLVFSQINEMDDALDRMPLQGGPFEEGLFSTVQEKMTILIQLRLTFPTKINLPSKCKKL